QGTAHTSIDSKPSGAARAAAGDGRDDALGRHAANSYVVEVGNVKGAVRGNVYAPRSIEPRLGGWAAVPGETLGAACNGSHDAVPVDVTNSVVVTLRDVEARIRTEADVVDRMEERGGRRAPVT